MADQTSTLRDESTGRLAPAVDASAAVARVQQAAEAVRREVGAVSRAAVSEWAPPAAAAFNSGPAASGGSDLSFLSDVHLRVRIELGRTRMYLGDVLRLNEGSVVELDKPAGGPVDVFVNDRLIARGEVIILNDNFCVKVTEIIEGATA